MKPNFHRHIPSDVNYEMNLHMHDLWAFDFKERGENLSCLLYLCLLPSEGIHKREIPQKVPELRRSLMSLSVTFMHLLTSIS